MLFTLHKYIFRELLRVFLFAAVGLTLILSLGSILQPVQEYGVGPRQVVHLMGYFLPITLTFVLPMAALFAGALIYGRFASDNELDACRASGISLLTLTYPGLALAVMVAVANLFLSFYVMPVFVHRAEKSLKADAKQIVFRNIEKRRYYELPPDGRYLIYADRADMQSDTLSGVVVAEMKNNEMKNITTAAATRVLFRLHDTFNEVQIIAYKPSQMGPLGEGGANLGSLTREFGSLLGDEIEFKNFDEMREIQRDMMRFYPIAEKARQTYAQLIIEVLAQHIRAGIADRATRNGTSLESVKDTGRFYELLGTPNSVRFAADRCDVQGGDIEQDGAVELSGRIVIVEYDTDSKRPLRTMTSEKATLHLDGDRLAPTLTLDIRTLRHVESGEWETRRIVRGLILPQAVQTVADAFKTPEGQLDAGKLASGLSELSGLQPSAGLAYLRGLLDWEMRKASAEIRSEIHSRLVFGAGCIPMILIGIGLGILKRGGHLLSAFGASCVPAAVLIVCIMSGKQLTENLSAQTVPGIALMWAGLGFLSLLVVGIYGWLLRH